RGLPDDNDSYGGISLDDPNNFYPNSTDYLKALNLVGFPSIVFGSCYSLAPNFDSKTEINPDYFSYSLLNDSGKFIMDSEGNIHSIPKDDVIFLNKSTIIDSKGIKYEFDLYDSNITNVYPGTPPSYSSSYNIKRIILPQGD